jgi:hypothetical protein
MISLTGSSPSWCARERRKKIFRQDQQDALTQRPGWRARREGETSVPDTKLFASMVAVCFALGAR